MRVTSLFPDYLALKTEPPQVNVSLSVKTTIPRLIVSKASHNGGYSFKGINGSRVAGQTA